MTKIVRYILFLICAVQFFLAIAFFLQMPFAINLWPFQGTTPLTFIFLSSIFAAAAASTLWASGDLLPVHSYVYAHVDLNAVKTFTRGT